MSIPNRNLNYPTAIKFGAGRIKELADHCKANGISRPLFVTDPGLAAMPMVMTIVDDVEAGRARHPCLLRRAAQPGRGQRDGRGEGVHGGKP